MRLLRSEIYLLVWSMPMTAVGRLLGISSGSLGKTCERRGIPTPARGYWQKIGAGHEPPVPPPLGDVDVELPMPWERNQVVEAALARLSTSSGRVTRYGGQWVPPEGAAGTGSAQCDVPSDRVADSGEDLSAGASQDSGETDRQPISLDLQDAIQLARLLEDLRALQFLTELVLDAGSNLPGEEEDRLKAWVHSVRSEMRVADPLRQLVRGARLPPDVASGGTLHPSRDASSPAGRGAPATITGNEPTNGSGRRD